MQTAEIVEIIVARIREVARNKGVEVSKHMSSGSVLLGGDLPIDSLDLASILVQLEAETGLEPFADGFIEFHTIGELAELFSDDDDKELLEKAA